MKLYLVRHGEAVNVIDNLSRPLSENGVREVETIGRFLSKNQIQIDQIYHSDKLRGEQTAQILAKAINTTAIQMLPGLRPDDSIKPIVTYCNEWNENIMLVGHLPFMGNLATELLLGKEDQQCIEFQTASILCLTRESLGWVLSWHIYPNLVK